MTKAKTMSPGTPAALLKFERERDKAQAMLDYQIKQVARNENMERLRSLRLAREAGSVARPRKFPS